MKKLFIFALLPSISFGYEGVDKFSFRQVDKRAHMIGSYALTLSGSLLAQKSDLAYPELWGAGFSLLLGVAKEVKDSKTPGNYFSKADLIADGIGTTAGALFSYSLRF